MSDGYFSLDALNPNSLGIGGGTGGGYNFTQDAVFGIRPPTGDPVVEKIPFMTQHGSLAGYISNDSLKIDLFAENQAMWVNYNPSAMKVRFGGIIEPVDGGEKASAYFGKVNFTIDPGYGTDPKAWNAGIPLSELNLPDGTYKLTAATQPWDGDNTDWTPVRPVYGCYNYFTFSKSGDNYTVSVNDVDRLLITDGNVIGDLYYGMLTTVEVTVINESDHEMTRGYAPVIVVDNQPVLLGESIYLTVGPKSSETRRWTTQLYALSQYFSVDTDTEAQLTFYDEGTYEIYSDDLLKPIILRPNPGAPRLTLTGAPSVANAEKVYITSDLNFRFLVADKHKVDVTARVHLNSGLFGYMMFACLVDEDYSILAYNGYNVMMDSSSADHDFSTTLDCASAEAGKTYTLLMGYDFGGSNMVQIGTQSALVTFKDNSAGAGIVTADSGTLRFTGTEVVCEDSGIEIFNLVGVLVAEGRDRIVTEGMTPGVYVAHAGGKTLKFAIY